MAKNEEDVYDFDIETEDDHVLLTKGEMSRRREERKSRPLAEKAQKKALDSRVQEIMEVTRQSATLAVSDEMPQKTVTHLGESTQSSGKHLGAFEDTALMEGAEQVPSGSETTPFPRVELSTERVLDARHASAGVGEITNEQVSTMLREMGDIDDSLSLSSLPAVIDKPTAVDNDIAVSMDVTADFKPCPDSSPESTDQSGQMATNVNTANDKGRQGQGIDGAHLLSGDDEGMRRMKNPSSMPAVYVASPEALLAPVNSPSVCSLLSTEDMGLSEEDTHCVLQVDPDLYQLEYFTKQKIKAEARKNSSDNASDQFLNFQVPIQDPKLELLKKQPPGRDLGVVSSTRNTTGKKGTVSEATRKKIQQLERDLTAGTRPERRISCTNMHDKHHSVEEESPPPPPPPGTRQVHHDMLSLQNAVPLTKKAGIDNNDGMELEELKEELSRATEQILLLEACLKQSREDSTCPDGGKSKSGSNDEMEVLIQGYQKENERLVKQLKEAKKKHENERISLYEEHRQLGCQLNFLRNQVARQGSGGDHMSTNAEALRSQLALEAKVLQLQEQLEQEKKESAVLRSLGMDMKPIQQPFEDELASASVFRGIIEEGSKPEAAGENSEQAQLETTTAMMEVRSLQDELSTLRRNHETEVVELRQKVQWYVENAELVDKHVERLVEQDKEIERLKHAHAEQSPRSTRSNKSCSRCITSSKTIAKLKTQLVDLENASMKRNPDNVSSMIRAAKLRSDSIQKETTIRKINALEKELQKTKEDGIVRLRALRQEHERVCAGLRKRLKSESKTEEKENVGGTTSNVNSLTSGKPSNNREELVRMQQFYAKKLRKAEQKIMLQNAKIRRLSFSGGSTSTTSPQPQQDAKDGAPVSSEDKTLLSPSNEAARQATHEERIAALEDKLTRTTEALRKSKTTIDLIGASAASQQSRVSSEETSATRKEEGGVKYCVHGPEPIHRPPSGQAQRKKVTKVSRIPVPQAAESFSGLPDPRLIASEETCKALKRQVTELQREISDLKAREKFHSSPMDVKCDALAEQLIAVQRRAEARSLEVAHSVDSVRNEARIEMATVQANHKIELQSKATEIDILRRDLEELLRHLANLKAQSTVTAASG